MTQTSQASRPTPAHGLARPGVLLMVAGILGLAFEILFYGHRPGVSIFLWCALGVAGLLVSAAAERVRPSASALALLGLLLALGWMTYVRLEPLTVMLDVGLILVCLALVMRLTQHNLLFDFGWIDMALATVTAPLEAWVRPWPIIGQQWGSSIREEGRRKVVFSVLRGLALALPVLVVFGALLGAADLVFGDYLEAALRWLDLDRLAEYAGRFTLMVAVGVFCLGAMVVALRPQPEPRLVGKSQPLVAPFLGATEAIIILVALDLLFAAFVAVQFTYLFGGEANIHIAGYTYAEYARRGFGELVAVGVLSLGLIYALSAVTRRSTSAARKAYGWLSSGLVVLVGVILVSAYQRLALYESAYGFSRLRTYTHVALIWLGLTFIAFLILLWRERLRLVAPVALAVAAGFTLSLGLVNVDAFIVERNVERFNASGDVDVAYLLALSEDAMPGLVGLARLAPEEVREELLPQLACRRSALRNDAARVSWPSRHASRDRALAGLESLNDMLEPYRVVRVYHGDSRPHWPVYVVRWPDGQADCTVP
ncbi:MAG TPA: DUF4173 domain-containing protein [Anaerolineales bacterium]|nr:DUF4173 domain-containing protein [Anaerolineales bacterium]